LDELLDREPLIPEDLLRLAVFAAEYYLAPIGEVLRSLLPLDLPAWGKGKVRLTDAGALAFPRSLEEGEVIETLRESGPLTMSALQKIVQHADTSDRVRALEKHGWVQHRKAGHGGSRLITGFELVPRDLEENLKACGRSAPGRAVVEMLAALERPATTKEITTAVGCAGGVLRRLVDRGVLRRFTQMERSGLERHLLEIKDRPPITLRPDQADAVQAMGAELEERRFAPFLLRGMTGSGKTEVYLRVVRKVLAQGRGAILLVPEIALVPALARTVREHFGDQVALLHSGLSVGERRQEWQRIQRGEAKVVLGPRSAIFAPLPSLGLVVVDEEQDSSYKQDSTPRYNGRDLALVRGRDAGAVVLLVSATPSLESRHNSDLGRFGSLALTQRVGHGRLPEGILVDLKEEDGPRRPGEIRFSTTLRLEIERTLGAGSQVILLRNRRGYSPLLLCRACGEDMRCEDCGLPRTFHRRENVLLCHYCGSSIPVPRTCPKCKLEALEAVGTGTERVEEELREIFPGVALDVLDRDAVRKPGGASAVLQRFADEKTQMLVGTQMVSKGHHFPNVALTGVLSADSYLGFPDFRAVERTYNLLVQLAGRAGRGEEPGRVVIQTYHPDHYAIRAALENDDTAFIDEEMRFRRIFHYPPFTRMILLLLRDTNRKRGEERIQDLARKLEAHPFARGARVLGPAPAPLERLRGKWRFQLILRAPQGARLRQLMREVIPTPGPDLVVDVDPQDLL